MGDGNHSLATAKAIWEKAKEAAPDRTAIMASPLRYALVELVNLHDDALRFEPIHRVIFDTAPGRYPLEEMKDFYRGRYSFEPAGDFEAMKAAVDGAPVGTAPDRRHPQPASSASSRSTAPDSNLPVGTLQNFLDAFLKNRGAAGIDYVHGTDVVVKMGSHGREPGLLSPGHGQEPAVPHRHPGRGPAAQDLFHGRGLGEEVLHGGPEAFLSRTRRQPSAVSWRRAA